MACLTHCAASACDFYAVFAVAGCVSSAKTAVKFIETYAILFILTENRERFPQNALHTRPQSSDKPACPAQRACNDCVNIFQGFFVRPRLQSRRISNISTQKSRGFRPPHRAILAQKTRAARGECAQKQKVCLIHCAASACDFCAVFLFSQWFRVLRKNCGEFHRNIRNLRDFNRKS